ncbi:MAG: hypothetical protein RIS76_2853 [Verrucomicrobiota bacterium]
MSRLFFTGLVLALVHSAGWAAPSGEQIYRRLCVECHGERGEGVAGKYDETLHGERSVEALARLIDRTMPEDKPELCDSEESQAVARYIFDAFYSPAARARNHPARVELVRLTNRQYRESIADLFAGFLSPLPLAAPGGLRATYHQSKGMNKKDKEVLARTDASVNFDLWTNSPAEGITADQFSIAWSGSLIAPHTGVYELRLRTPNGARLYINEELRAGDSNRRDDSDARRAPALIDLWVSSGGEMREATARLFLLGGRTYPLRLDYFKFKEKTASLQFEWRPPHGVWSVPGARDLSPDPSHGIIAIPTTFPADDGSLGYERGTTVSKGWHEATTRAALEVADAVVSRLDGLAGVRARDTNRTARLQEFAATVAARAFRRPLTDDLRQRFINDLFVTNLPPETSVKRALLLVLKSPRFLYPDLGEPADDSGVAARLALVLWDSLPDVALREAADRGALRSPEQVREQARRMIAAPQARAKLQGFFEHWLSVEEADDVSKDEKTFPGFDAALRADLRYSLELLVEQVVWSEASDYRELLLADYVPVNARLAKFYGVEAPDGDGFLKVRFDPGQRAGIFTHPFLLSTFAYHRSSSPIHRGVFLTRNVLGRFLKPPPMAIEFMDDRFDPSLTMREKVTELTRKEACMGCHSTINPLGFSLENFDAVGRFRTTDNAKPVDAQSEYLTADGERVMLRGARDLATHAAGSADARRGFVRQLFQHTVKQAPAAYGPDTLNTLDREFLSSGCHIRNLVMEIAAVASLNGLSTTPPTAP